jgi:hypothetical protein
MYVNFPVTEENISRVKRGFQNRLHFPYAISGIDCTHVAIFTTKGTDRNNPPVAY